MRPTPARRAICADCTANYGVSTPFDPARCGHASNSAFVPRWRVDQDVPAASLERAPRTHIVELAQLFVAGRRLYEELTRRDSWDLRVPAHVVDAFADGSYGGDTFDSDLRTVHPREGFAVAIRPGGAAPVRVPFDRPRDVVLSTRAPYVGVFGDNLTRTVDVDPVAIVATLREADALGVYCGSTGGAYSFADGLGYWAPVL